MRKYFKGPEDKLPDLDAVESWIRHIHPGKLETFPVGHAVSLHPKGKKEDMIVRALVVAPDKKVTLHAGAMDDDRPLLHVDFMVGDSYRIPLDCCNDFEFRAAVVVAQGYWTEQPRAAEYGGREWWFKPVHAMVKDYLVQNRAAVMHPTIVRFSQLVADTYVQCEDAQMRHSFESIRSEIKKFAHRISEEDLIRLYREVVVQKVLDS